MLSEQVYQKNSKYYKNLLIRKFGIDYVEQIDEILIKNTNLLKTTQNYKILQKLVKETTKDLKQEKSTNNPLDKHIQKMQSLINPSLRNLSKEKQQKNKNLLKRKTINSQRQLNNYNTLAQKSKQNNDDLKKKIKEQINTQNEKFKKSINKSPINYQKPSYDKNFLAKIEKFLKADDEKIEQNISLSSIEQKTQNKNQKQQVQIKEVQKKPKKMIKKFLNSSQKNKPQGKKFSELCKEIEVYEQRKKRANSRSFVEDLKEMKDLSNSFVSQELFEVEQKIQKKDSKVKIKNKFKQNIASMRKLIN